jgi:hypothetical protein
MNRNQNEVIIIGGGLSGLLVAVDLLSKGEKVFICEMTDHAGGLNRAAKSFHGIFENSLKFIPNDESSWKALAYLSQLTNLNLEPKIVANSPITYESGQFKAFVGFGDKAPEFHQQISYFLTPERIEISIPIHELVSCLIEKVGSHLHTKYIVTKILETDKKVTGVMVNGSKLISSDRVVFAGCVKELSHLIPESIFNAKMKQKISKGDYWSALGLDILHSTTLSEKSEMHMLNGTTQDEIGPCVGRFFSSTKDGQFSQWITFLDRESAEDAEIIGLTLKKMKKQIKRAYPAALESIQFERILVAPNIEGDFAAKMDANQTLANLENLWIASGIVNKSNNIIGSILQSKKVSDSISPTKAHELPTKDHELDGIPQNNALHQS